MTVTMEWETSWRPEFSGEELVSLLLKTTLEQERCPYDARVDVLVVEAEEMKRLNGENRNLDQVTDVLSFPLCDFSTPGDFAPLEESPLEYFHPETGELLLGDIVLCKERILSQAEEYGHSIQREFAFLVVHSLLHLCGFDHMEEEERKQMEEEQRKILTAVDILRR